MLWGELQAAGVPPSEVDKITWENACRFFGFDAFQHRAKEDATVAALRALATDVDVSETSRAAYKERYFARV